MSIASPIFAAATLPVGIPAVLATELTALTLLAKSTNEAFVKRWKQRTVLVLASVAVVSAAIAPAIRHKATDYWADKSNPFSFEAIQDVIAAVVLQKTNWVGVVPVLLVALGLYFRRNDFLGRASLGLAIVFPLLIIGVSVFKSVLVSRYFLPVLPGTYLLAAGAADKRINVRTLLATIAVLLVAFAFFKAPSRSRLQTKQAEQQLSVLQRLEVDEIVGVATHPYLDAILEHYIPRRLGIPANVGYVRHPLKEDELPDGKVLWVFGHKKQGPGDHVVEGLNPLCHFRLKSSQIYVVARKHIEAPFDMNECAQQR